MTVIESTVGSGPDGLTDEEAARRLRLHGPNAVRTHRVRAPAILARQVRSPLLLLLLAAATVSAFVGERADAYIIGAIVLLSVGLGFVNEYRAERASTALHERIRHTVIVVRGGRARPVDVTTVVPGDVVRLALGTVVPADLRLLSAENLECDESILTGESIPVAKAADSAALMGSVVRSGRATGVVQATGSGTRFGRLALSLGERHPETRFQEGLRRFSRLLAVVAGVLTVAIFATNLLLHRPLLDAVLFALAIAVGITPQLLPAVVTTSLATGSRRLARSGVLVKRLVCIEDLGDIDILVTDKTGTLTQGTVALSTAVAPDGTPLTRPLELALLCTDQAAADSTANLLDAALWAADPGLTAGYRRVAVLPFDHDRRRSTVVVQTRSGARILVTKGASESVLPLCRQVSEAALSTLTMLYATGARVIAVASRRYEGTPPLSTADECGLALDGFVTFTDPVKNGAADALNRLAALGVRVKIATGDSGPAAQKACADLGLAVSGTLTGDQIDGLDDADLAAAARAATVFARVSPDQKARLIRALRTGGQAVAFLGDGVNDAVALHAADVGLSVDTATDVAKDAADVILLTKDLGVLADGVVDGRRIFTNTVKYVLMGSSSNFGNMFSAAGASAFLPFLPMLPSQILLNNLLYDTGQLAIPTDRVDTEQLSAPSHWDLGLIRRFMLFFGPISSLFDFLTFAVMLGVFHAGAALFHTGWFVESLATQTLIIFAIRTRRTPLWRSRPGMLLAATACVTVAAGAVLPWTPLAGPLGFQPLPAGFFVALCLLVVAYLALVEGGKRLFFRTPATAPPPPRWRSHEHRVHRRAARFTVARRPVQRPANR